MSPANEWSWSEYECDRCRDVIPGVGADPRTGSTQPAGFSRHFVDGTPRVNCSRCASRAANEAAIVVGDFLGYVPGLEDSPDT
jgi:hypothetical protein